MNVTLLQKKGDLTAQLPPGWSLAQTIFKEGQKEVEPPARLLARALTGPIESPPLEALLKPSAKVALVVDDLTRPTPVAELLPPLLEKIEAGGVARNQVDIVIGTGTHRPMDRAEMELRLGKEVVGDYRVHNHDPKAPDLVVMGELPDYGPIAFNRVVAQADVKIIVGSILPHVHNGFGGGPKNIMPAVCDFETIRRHHLTHVLHHRARVGIFKDNPFLDRIRTIADLAKVDFAVQCVYDSFGRIYDVLCGGVNAVHRTGAGMETQGLGVKAQGRTEVTIVSSFPYDEGPQIMKSFMPAGMVTQPGGSILVVTELKQPLPDFFLDNAREMRGDGSAEAVRCTLDKLEQCQPLIENGPMDFNMAIILVLSVARRFRLTLIGDQVLESAAQAMGYLYQPDLDSALKEEARLKPQAEVSLIPGGGYIFPVLDEPFHLFGEE